MPPKVQCTQLFQWLNPGIFFTFTIYMLWKHNCVGVGVISFGDMPGFSDVGSGG